MKSTANTLYDAWKRDGDPHFYDLPESERARWEAVAAEVDRATLFRRNELRDWARGKDERAKRHQKMMAEHASKREAS